MSNFNKHFFWVIYLALLAGCTTGIEPRPPAVVARSQTSPAESLPQAQATSSSNAAIASISAAPSGGGKQGYAAQRVYFMHGTDIAPNESEKVIAQARWLVANNTLRVMLTGYMPERGSRSYEMAIAEKRVRTVAAILQNHGVAKSQIRVNGYYRYGSACDVPCGPELPFVGLAIFGGEAPENEKSQMPQSKQKKKGTASVRAK